MRSITLLLPDDQFGELYSMSKMFVATNQVGECAIADLMKNIHNECEDNATDDEREFLASQIKTVLPILTEDSPDRYLATAGMTGLAKRIIESL